MICCEKSHFNPKNEHKTIERLKDKTPELRNTKRVSTLNFIIFLTATI